MKQHLSQATSPSPGFRIRLAPAPNGRAARPFLALRIWAPYLFDQLEQVLEESPELLVLDGAVAVLKGQMAALTS